MSKKKPTEQLPNSRNQEALERYYTQLNQIPLDDLIAINIDIPTAVGQAFAAAAKMDELKSSLADLFQQDMVQPLDELVDIACALTAAHGKYLQSSDSVEVTRMLTEEGLLLRQQILADVKAQVAQNRLLMPKLPPNPRTAQAVAFDLFALVSLYRESWEQIDGRTTLDSEMLAQAEALGQALLEKQEEKSSGVMQDATSLLRSRAYTLFVRSYDHARRVAVFARWHEGDVDQIVPSLYQGRRKKAARDKKPTPTAEIPAVNSNQPLPEPIVAPSEEPVDGDAADDSGLVE